MPPQPFSSTFASAAVAATSGGSSSSSSPSFKASPLAKLVVVVALLSSVPLSDCLDHGRDDGQAGLMELLGNGLEAKRNFLRFGKRAVVVGNGDDYGSGFDVGQVKRDSSSSAAADQGPGEQFEATLMGKNPHRSSTRSFLRFGKRDSAAAKRKDNFLRFGRDALLQLDDGGNKDDRRRLMQKLALLSLLYGEDGQEPRLEMSKKANDFLRFG